MEALEVGTEVQTELLDELGPGDIELAQCLRLPSRPIESQHQLAPQALPQRVLGDELAQSGHDELVLTELQAGVDLVLARGGAQLVEPGDLSHGESLVRHVLEGFATPQPERLLQLTEGPLGLVG